MITYEDAGPHTAIRENILIDGEKIGEIWEMKHGFQCQLSVPGSSCPSLNGIGESKLLAIQDAIDSGRKNAAAMLTRADEVEKGLEVSK